MTLSFIPILRHNKFIETEVGIDSIKNDCAVDEKYH